MTCPVRFQPRGQPTNLPLWRLPIARSRTWLGSEPGSVCVSRSVCRPAQGAPRYDIVLLLSSRHFKAICIFDGPQPFSSLFPRKIPPSLPLFPPQSSFALSRHFFRPFRHRRGGLSLSLDLVRCVPGLVRDVRYKSAWAPNVHCTHVPQSPFQVSPASFL